MSILPIAFAFIALAAGIALALGWRERLLMILPYLATLNRIVVPVGGTGVRLDQLAACLLCIPLVIGALTQRRRFRVTRAMLWLAAIFAMNVIASIANSPVPQYSLTQCVNLASVWVLYPVLVNMLREEYQLARFTLHVLRAGIIACVVGAGAYILSVAGFPVGGAETGRVASETFVSAYGAYGTMVEPNVLGGFAAAHFALGLLLWGQLPRGHEARATARVLTIASAVALVLTFTRSAWLGAFAAMLVIALLQSRASGSRLRQIVRSLAVVAVLGVVALLLPGEAGSFLRFKLVNLVNVASPTALTRLVIYRMALLQTEVHPVLGSGTFSFAALASESTDFTRYEGWHNLWIGNYLLLALHDTGVIGLAMWIALLGGTWLSAWRAVRTTIYLVDVARTRMIGLLVAYSVLLVAFLATSALTLGYPWMLIGLLAAHVEHASAHRAELSPGANQDPVAPPA